MMGIGPDEAKKLTYWEFTAMRYIWNERHKDPNESDSGEDIEPPSVEFVRARQKRLAELGLTGKAEK